MGDILQTIHGLKYMVSDNNGFKLRLSKNLNLDVSILIEAAELLPTLMFFLAFVVLVFVGAVSPIMICALCLIAYLVGFGLSNCVTFVALPPITFLLTIYQIPAKFFFHYGAVIILSLLVRHDWQLILYLVIGKIVLTFLLSKFSSYEKRMPFNNRVIEFVERKSFIKAGFN